MYIYINTEYGLKHSFNILYAPYNTEKIRHAHRSKHIFKSGNQVVLLTITCSHIVHLIQQKIGLINVEVKSASESFAKM